MYQVAAHSTMKCFACFSPPPHLPTWCLASFHFYLLDFVVSLFGIGLARWPLPYCRWYTSCWSSWCGRPHRIPLLFGLYDVCRGCDGYLVCVLDVYVYTLTLTHKCTHKLAHTHTHSRIPTYITHIQIHSHTVWHFVIIAWAAWHVSLLLQDRAAGLRLFVAYAIHQFFLNGYAIIISMYVGMCCICLL